MGAPGIIAGAQIGGSLLSAYGQKSAADAQSNYYSYLASTSLQNAGLVKAAGESNARSVSAAEADELQRTGQRVRETVGIQKAAMVGGVGIGSRSAQNIVKDTLTKGDLDEQAIRMNAELKRRAIFSGAGIEEFNLKNQASGYGIAGANVRAALPFQLGSTLLGGAGQAASSWYMMTGNIAKAGGAM